MTLNLEGKNWAIKIILMLDTVFFVVAVVLMLTPHKEDVGQKVWEVFMGANGALMLLLNAEGKKQTGAELPPDIDPSKVKTTQSVEVTTTTVPTSPTTTPAPVIEPPKEGG